MTAKDYKLIATELSRSNPGPVGPDEPYDERIIELKKARYVGFWLAVEAVARALALDNPRFDRERFYAAVEDDRGNDDVSFGQVDDLQ